MLEIRLDAERIAKLDNAARSLGYSRQDVLNQAIDSFADHLAEKADYEKWFARKVARGIKAADEGKLVSSAEVAAHSEAIIASYMAATSK